MARADVFDYIERFYNAKRRHSRIGDLRGATYRTPLALRRLPDRRQAASRKIRLFTWGTRARIAQAAPAAKPLLC